MSTMDSGQAASNNKGSAAASSFGANTAMPPAARASPNRTFGLKHFFNASVITLLANLIPSTASISSLIDC